MAHSATRTEKKIEKELDRAEKEHEKAAVKEAKGHLHSAERHENKAMAHESRADGLAHNVSGIPAGAIAPGYTGLNFPHTGATAHPTYGYARLPRDKKAERLEAKAVEWEKRGNGVKAQKNREKALRHRQRLVPGYTPIAHPQPYYVDKANRFDQRALRYQQLGLTPQAQRYQQRALRTRNKHGITGFVPTTYVGHTTLAGPTTLVSQGAQVGPITPVGGLVYKGISQPYTGATSHPTYGYNRLPHDQKAQRYETKAAEWERRGDKLKAQKNREKANRYRSRGQAGYVKPNRGQDYYINKALHLDQKARRAQQMGRNDQALRNQQRAQRIRTKHHIPAAGLGAAGLGAGLGAGSLSKYSGLNHPYSGAVNHPKYGYQRLPRDQKAQRFEAKAAEWQKRGNMQKAQKNREKAQRLRAASQPGYVKPVRPANYYSDRANLFDQRARQYQQWGMAPQAQRYQGRSQRIRAKHNIPLVGGLMGANRGLGQPQQTYTSSWQPTPTYSGLNFPYSGAVAHPQYGYQRVPHNAKAERFEAKAAEWQKRGNMQKAQKNREKAQRYRARSQPGYVKPVRQPDYYQQRATVFDHKANQYQQWGMAPQAQRYQGRAQRTRAKHNIPIIGKLLHHGQGAQGHPQQTYTSSWQPTPTYSGLSFPYTGAGAHPQYGYQRLPHNAKAERFEAKAAEWQKRGNMQKAQKNREKAQRYRARSQPGYVRPVRQPDYYSNRANVFDHKAYQYQQWGMAPQATRYQQRAQRIRTKHGLPVSTTSQWTTGGTQYGPIVPVGSTYVGSWQPTATYSGLSFPYAGAAAHPQYGYQRLPHNKKAERFEAKAAEWERRGNMKKAQKNREKANRYRARSQPGYVAPVRPQTYYVDRANLFDQKARQYQQWGMAPQATRYQQRAQRVRTKRGLPMTAGTATVPLYSAPVAQRV